MNGFVYLVGAGPGDPELMTVRGYELVCAADCIVHDRLIAREMLAWAKPAATRINVGKAPTKKRFPQSEINRILIEEARKGQTVVRLKGGDPFVFGLGGDECIALAEAGIPYEIVPGVSSVSAVPAYAGIPVTHRGLASSVVVLSGHSLDKDGDGSAWHNLPRTGSIVVLMGVRKLAQIVALVQVKRPSTTPIAIIQSGTTPSQHTVIGTLETIVAQAHAVAPPAMIVIGDVVNLREQLAWFVAEGGRAEWLPAASNFS